jgi:hypothetical protein
VAVSGFGPFEVQPAEGAAEVVVYSDDHLASLPSTERGPGANCPGLNSFPRAGLGTP